MPAMDPAEYPTMAALAPLQDDFGSAAQFDRLLDAVLSGIRSRADGGVTRSAPSGADGSGEIGMTV